MSDRQTSCRLIRTDSGRVGAETRARLSRACGHKSTQRLGCWVSLDPAPFRPRRLILGFHGSNRSNIQNGTDETRKAPGWPGSSTLTEHSVRFCGSSCFWLRFQLDPFHLHWPFCDSCRSVLPWYSKPTALLSTLSVSTPNFPPKPLA